MSIILGVALFAFGFGLGTAFVGFVMAWEDRERFRSMIARVYEESAVTRRLTRLIASGRRRTGPIPRSAHFKRIPGPGAEEE